MKKQLLLFTTLVMCIFLFAHCKKDDDTVFNFHFYTHSNSIDDPLYLYIDGQLKGELPFHSNNFDCSSDSLLQKSISLSLVSGEYLIEAKDKNGNLKTGEKIKFTSTSSSARSLPLTTGGMYWSGDSDCSMFDIFID